MKKCVSVTAGAVAAVGLVLASTTGAAASSAGARSTSTTYSAAQIRAASVGGSSEQLSSAGAARRTHLEAQARDGRLLDAKSVHAASLPDGVATWEAGTVIDQLRVGRTRHPVKASLKGQGDATGEVLELAMVSGEEPDGQVAPAGARGVGMTGATSLSGGRFLSNYCQTWTVSGSSVTSCGQKIDPTNDGSSTRDYVAYNRYVTAVGKAVSWADDYLPVYINAASRPRAGYESRTKGLSGYFPTSGSQLCHEGTSVSLGVGSASFNVGLRDCGDKTPIPNATVKQMQVKYDDGFFFGGPRSKGVDFEMELMSFQGGAVPLLGDYNYAKFCQTTLADCTGTKGLDGW